MFCLSYVYVLYLHVENHPPRIRSVPSLRFCPIRGYVGFILLVVCAFPSTQNHIFGTTNNTLMNLYTPIIHFINNTWEQSLLLSYVSTPSFPEVTQAVIK